MPLFLLIRHGENDYVKTGRMAGRLPEVHLNERGRQQALELAGALGGLPLTALYSSPLERARETAAPLAEKLGLQAQIRPGLIETGVGDWAGQEIKALRRLPEWKTVQGAPSRFRFPNGELFAETQHRLVEEVELLARAHAAHELVAIVSHADPIKLLVAYYLGMPLDAFQRLSCDTASVTVLLLGEQTARLMRLNQRPPFELEMPAKPAKTGKAPKKH